MDKINELLKYVRKSNPEITRDNLIYELEQCNYSSVGLVITWQNSEKQAV